MKYKISILIVLFPVLAWAQSKEHIDSLARTIISDLEESWTLGVDSNSDAVDLMIYNNYKSLFDANAKITDEFNAFYDVNTGEYFIYNLPKPFDVYAHDIALQVRKLNVGKVDTLSVNFSNPENMVVVLRRTVEAEKPRNYVIDAEKYATDIFQRRKDIDFNNQNPDTVKLRLIKLIKASDNVIYKFRSEATLHIKMAYKNDTVRIISIDATDCSLLCTNDLEDNDGIVDGEDKSPNSRGEFTAEGRPDYDLDGVTDDNFKDKCRDIYGIKENSGCPKSYFTNNYAVDGFAGLQFNSANINTPELNKLGYKDASGKSLIDVLQSEKGEIKKIGLIPSFNIGANLNYYFQKVRGPGISFGIAYTRFTAKYEVTKPIVYTYKSSDGFTDYRRRIRLRQGSTETVRYNITNLPLMFDYLLYSKKWTFQISAGPSLMLFRNLLNYNVHIDFEGLYQVDTVNKDKITYYDYFDNSTTWNIYVTGDSINAQNPIPGSEYIFNELDSNYNFASNRVYNGNKKSLSRTTFALNLKFDGIYKITNEISVKVGLQFTYAPLNENSKKYKPIDKTDDTYNSLYNSQAKKNYYCSYNINAGILYGFK